MLIRHNTGNRPTFTFTADYHELVRGDLMAGTSVVRYDPFRIVPPEEISTLPATQRPVIAECVFHPGHQHWCKELRLPPATFVRPDWDPTGQGTMLESEMAIPEGTTEFEFWFAYTDANGEARHDSRMGRNFWIRFASHDLKIDSASVARRDSVSAFSVSVLSVPEVESMIARWRLTAQPTLRREEKALTAADAPDGRKRWSSPDGGFSIAPNSPVAFDLVYTIKGHSYTDDNEGTWYIVPLGSR
jgi:hypothetical protein